MFGSVILHKGRLCLIYAVARSFARINSTLEDCFATGDILESEFRGIVRRGGRYCLLVNAD